jgi:protein tyrosine phosphatase (PTP) superfamily phosphohydrolase (DUF442 family)
MNKKKNSWQAFLFAAALILLIVLMVKHFHVQDFRIVHKDILYISGQPRGMDYTRLLYKYHIGTIVNVRPAAEHRDQNWYAEETSWVRQNGVNYVELPLDKKNYLPDPNTQNKFLAIMADPKNLPVLLHGSGNTERVAMLTAVWMIKTKGSAPQAVVSQVENILERPLNSKESEFISSLSTR